MRKFGKQISILLIVTSLIVQIPMIFITYQNSIEAFEDESQDTRTVIEHSIQSSLDFVTYVAVLVENFDNVEGDNLETSDFVSNPDSTYYSDLDVGEDVGHIRGYGELPLSEDVMAEVNFAVGLNEYFAEFYETNSSVTAVYYISENDFIYSYPAQDSVNYPYTDAFYTKEYYTSCLPENNPDKEPQWSSPYLDYSDQGVMVTLSQPIYEDETFLGVVGVDFATSALSTLLNIPYDSYICDTSSNILATNTKDISQAEFLSLSSVAGESTDEIENMIDEQNESMSYVDGAFVYTTPIENTDWTLISSYPLQSIIIENIAITLVFLLISLLLIINYLWINKRRRQFELEHQKLKLEEEVLEKAKALRATQEAAIDAISDLVESRDGETGGHIQRTKQFVKLIATELAKTEKYKDFFDEATINELYLLAPLHDIGKVAIPDAILQKPVKLTDEEFEIMKTHTTLGGNALRYAFNRLGEKSFLTTALCVAECHHEKWDGSGYPKGLSGEGIPLSARIVALADVYDALTSERIYKSAMSHEEAKEIIANQSGNHFDPDIVNAFLNIEKQFESVAKEID